MRMVYFDMLWFLFIHQDLHQFAPILTLMVPVYKGQGRYTIITSLRGVNRHFNTSKLLRLLQEQGYRRCIMCFYGLQCQNKILQIMFKGPFLSPNVTKSHQMSPNLSNVTKSHQMSPNLSNVTKSHQMSPNLTKCHQVLPNVNKYQLSPFLCLGSFYVLCLLILSNT